MFLFEQTDRNKIIVIWMAISNILFILRILRTCCPITATKISQYTINSFMKLTNRGINQIELKINVSNSLPLRLLLIRVGCCKD